MIEEKQRAWEEMSLEEHMKIYEDQGIGRKDAMKMVAKDRGSRSGRFIRVAGLN